MFQTLWFKNRIALIISKFVRNPKQRMNRQIKENTLNCLFNVIITLNSDRIYQQLKLSHLDKSNLNVVVDDFINKTNVILDNEVAFYQSLNKGSFNLESSNTIAQVRKDLFSLPTSFITRTNKEVSYWYDKYLKFRELILSKYYRLAYKCAKITKLNKPSIDIDCLFKSLILSMNTALDKYTATKGTLTSYIQLWFKSTIVDPKYEFEIGRPFKLSNYGKQKLIDIGSSPNAISTDDESFTTIESNLDLDFLNTKLENYEIMDVDLLRFINSVQDNNIDLVKIILNIPQVLENCKK